MTKRLDGAYRKQAKRMGDERILAKWDPVTVDAIRSVVASIERQAKAKRRKKRPTIQA